MNPKSSLSMVTRAIQAFADTITVIGWVSMACTLTHGRQSAWTTHHTGNTFARGKCAVLFPPTTLFVIMGDAGENLYGRVNHKLEP